MVNRTVWNMHKKHRKATVVIKQFFKLVKGRLQVSTQRAGSHSADRPQVRRSIRQLITATVMVQRLVTHIGCC